MILNEEEIRLVIHALNKQAQILDAGRELHRVKNDMNRALAVSHAIDVCNSALFKMKNELKDEGKKHIICTPTSK